MLVDEALREQLAALAHERWSRWMTYLFELSAANADGSVTIPTGLVERWQRQIATPYSELSSSERISDRAESDRVLALLQERPAVITRQCPACTFWYSTTLEQCSRCSTPNARF